MAPEAAVPGNRKVDRRHWGRTLRPRFTKDTRCGLCLCRDDLLSSPSARPTVHGVYEVLDHSWVLPHAAALDVMCMLFDPLYCHTAGEAHEPRTRHNPSLSRPQHPSLPIALYLLGILCSIDEGEQDEMVGRGRMMKLNWYMPKRRQVSTHSFSVARLAIEWTCAHALRTRHVTNYVTKTRPPPAIYRSSFDNFWPSANNLLVKVYGTIFFWCGG